jgi:Spy/CpxP family protein refolding chaperone
MKPASYAIALSLGLILVLTAVIPAQSGMMGQRPMGPSEGGSEAAPGGMMGQRGMGMMGQGGMGGMGGMGQGGMGGMGMMGPQMMQQMMRGMMGGGMQGMPEGMGTPRPSQMVRMLKAELGLSDEQTKQLTQILFQATKTSIKQRADIRVAELELRELLEADPVDMAQVEAKLKAIEGLRTALRLALIKTHEQAKGLLTPEQRQKLEDLHDRLHGTMSPGMMGMMEMMGEGGAGGMGMMGQGGMGGMGGMGMMGPQMMRGMMGGGMGGQSQSPQQMAGGSPQLTQEDTQGAATVSATLLTPDKPRADGKLAVQVKLETHTVDLDQYQLEKLAFLRDAQGRQVQALGLESPSGSGHHREGVLTFPGTDASGKPLLSHEANTLTLILRGIGGVAERGLRWQLPAK